MVLIASKAGRRALLGTCAFTTAGLGITPTGQMGLVQAADTETEAMAFADWFEANWNSLKGPAAPDPLLSFLTETASQRPPSLLYFKFMFELFKDLGDELDEERIVKSATGIRNTAVWNKLFKFQRDGVVGAIDKLERIGGCITADSNAVGFIHHRQV